MTPEPYPEHAPVPLWRDVRVLRVAGQIVVLLGVGLFVAFLARNFLTAIDQRGLGFGFGFLGRTAGFEIAESPIPYSATDTYGAAFLAGLLNTLFVSVVGIVLATFLGIVVGVARLSNNWLVRQIASGYVEIMRNTPLLVQLLLIYFAVLLRLPPISDTIELPGSVYLNQRGVFIPSPVVEPGLPILIGFVIAGIVVAVILRRLSRQRRDDGLPTYRLGLVGLAAFALLAVAGWLIGEVVRGGIQAVRRGQVEAARALGLSEGETLKLIVFPQALRIIVPPLTSQYLNLAKNSSLAIAIGYPDLFKVGVTMSNQTGQPVPVVILIMGTYLSISLVTSLLMNIYNRRVQVLER